MHKTFTNEQAAQRFVAAVDRAEGLPRDEGPDTGARRVGGGKHVPWLRLVTETYAHVRKHPSRDEWAVPITEMAERHQGKNVDPGNGGGPVRIDTSDAEELDETWWQEPEA